MTSARQVTKYRRAPFNEVNDHGGEPLEDEFGVAIALVGSETVHLIITFVEVTTWIEHQVPPDSKLSDKRGRRE